MKLSTIAGAGLSFGGRLNFGSEQAPAAALIAKAHGFKTNITPIAIADDCARLAIHSHDTSKLYKQALAQNWDAMRIGGILRNGKKHIGGLLNRARDGINNGQIDPKAARNVAFASGWLFHRAANNELYANHNNKYDEDERMIYHDARVLMEMSVAEHGGKMDDKSPDSTVNDMHHLLLVVKQRTELRLHTFNPDERSKVATENWVVRLGEWDKNYRLLLAQYAEAMVSPDSRKVKKYLEVPVFYDRTDAIIRCARGLQAGLHEPVDLMQAVAASKSQSLYARVLAKGYEAATVVSAFLAGEIDDGVLKTKLFSA